MISSQFGISVTVLVLRWCSVSPVAEFIFAVVYTHVSVCTTVPGI